MAMRIEIPTDDHFQELVDVDTRAFAYAMSDKQRVVAKRALDLSRFRVATDEDSGAIVGVAGSYAFDITLPGGAQLPMAGVTWVSVEVTYRRQGILRQMMDAIHADSVGRGEAIQGLTASEGGIYERFGYGVATRHLTVEVDARRAKFIDQTPVPAGAVQIVDARKNVPGIIERWNRFAAIHPGELTRTEAHQNMMMCETDEPIVAALHQDGFATWAIKSDWNDGVPQHELQLFAMAASKSEAYEHLWKTVLAHDLVGSVKSTLPIGPDDPLPSLVTNPRLVKQTGNRDGVWLRVSDPVTAFGARAYRINDSMIVKIEGTTYRIGSGGCDVSTDTPDIEMTAAASGSLLLGGVSATSLARGGRLSARSPEQLGRADALFGWSPRAHCRTGF